MALWAIFGSPLQPLYHLLFRGLPFPLWIIVISLLIGGIAAYLTIRMMRPGFFSRSLRWPAGFGLVLPLVSFVVASLITGTIREAMRSELSPDAYESQPLFVSFRTVPSGLDLHAVALKDCRPYAWSYGEMAFYPLDNPNIAVNVIPAEWVKTCGIARTR